MGKPQDLNSEDRARIIEIQDLLIENFVEYKEVIGRGEEDNAKKIDAQIENLRREKQNLEK
jgi:hypothetical protein